MQHIHSNAKLALLYDWLFFNRSKDNVMNLEPEITLSLVEFLLLQAKHYDASDTEGKVRNGITTSLEMCIKQVPSFEGIFKCAMHPTLKNMLTSETSPFMQVKGRLNQTTPAPTPAVKRPRQEDPANALPPTKKRKLENGEGMSVTAPPKQVKKNRSSKPSLRYLKDKLVSLESAYKAKEKTSDIVNGILSDVLKQKQAVSSGVFIQSIKDLALFFVESFFDEYKSTTLSDLKYRSNAVLFDLFAFYMKHNDDTLLTIIKEMRELELSVGFRFIYFLLKSNNCINATKGKNTYEKLLLRFNFSDMNPLSAYSKLVQMIGDEKKCIIEDLKESASNDISILLALAPNVFKYINKHTLGNKRIIRLLCTGMYPGKLFAICGRIRAGDFGIIGADVDKVIEGSLKWPSLQQYCLWKLIEAEFDLEGRHYFFLSKLKHILPQIDPKENVEVIQGLTDITVKRPPSKELLQQLFGLSLEYSSYITSAMYTWTANELMCKIVFENLNIIIPKLEGESISLAIIPFAENKKLFTSIANPLVNLITANNLVTHFEPFHKELVKLR